MEVVNRVGAGADVGLGGGPCGRPWWRVEMQPSSATAGGHKGPPPTSTPHPPLRETQPFREVEAYWMARA